MKKIASRNHLFNKGFFVRSRQSRGDTLIEVMLAVGIFSLVAISVVSISSLSSSKSQNTLLTTMAREEIDAQSEAIRFIHSAYISERSSTGTTDPSTYTSTWKKIADSALSNATAKVVTTAAPASCRDNYNGFTDSSGNTAESWMKQANAFIINTRNVSSGQASIVKYNSADSQFAQSSTYPRLIFGSNDNDSLAGNSENNLFRAEGIYDFAVKGSTGTSTYYDIYIRTCWYAGNDSIPSTISTVIRLYDPENSQ